MALIKLEPFENVSAAGTALLKTTRLWPNTLESIVLLLGGGPAPTKAQISRIVVRFGAKPVWDVTGSQLNSINLYEGRPSAATVLTLNFSEPRARSIESQFIGAPDFSVIGQREVTLEVTLAGGVAPTLEAWAEVAPPKLLSPTYNALFRALLRTPLAPSAAVVEQPQQINYGQAGGSLLRRMHFFSALVTQVKVKRDGLDYFEAVPVAVNNAILDELGHDPQANVYTLDFVPDDNQSKALTTIRNDQQGGSLVPQQILLTTSGAGAFDVIADVFAHLNGV